jgi:AbrB family looped-hinge helix DNA binding protein
VRITSKGQVTIPQTIRQQLGLLPNTEVDFELEGKGVRLVKMKSRKGESRGTAIVRHLRESKGGTVNMSTDEIMALMRGE